MNQINNKEFAELLANNYSITEEKQQKVLVIMVNNCLEKWPVGLSVAVSNWANLFRMK
jgi:hypothetical protein